MIAAAPAALTALLGGLRDVVVRHLELGQVELGQDLVHLRIDAALLAVALGTGVAGIAFLEAAAALALAPHVGAAAACGIVGLSDLAAAVATAVVARGRLRERQVLATTRRQVVETLDTILGDRGHHELPSAVPSPSQPPINPR